MDEQNTPTGHAARRPSGRDAKRAARTARASASIPYITRKIPYYEVLDEEGLATIRMQTVLALAHGIQATLVPTLSLQVDRFEVYGKSIPSTEMGGDLIDAVESDGTLLAYVADISGHGLAAGQLMGMLKTAIRVCLQFRQQPTAVLESADRVLPRSRRRTCSPRSRFCTSTDRPKRSTRWQAIRRSCIIAG